MSAAGLVKDGQLVEEKPAGDPGAAEGAERAAIAEASRREADAGASDRGPGGAAGGGGAAKGGAALVPVSAFDREAAEKRIGETGYSAMTKRGMSGAEECIYSAADLELLTLDIIALKKPAAKKERETAKAKWGALDLADLQKKRDVLTDRASAWRKRAMERAEEDWKAGRRSADLQKSEEKKARFRKLIAGERPFKLWNKGAGKLADEDLLGPAAQVLEFDKEDMETLAPLYDAALDENVDLLYEWFGLISPTTIFAGALVASVGMKSFACYKLLKHAKEEPKK